MGPDTFEPKVRGVFAIRGVSIQYWVTYRCPSR